MIRIHGSGGGIGTTRSSSFLSVEIHTGFGPDRVDAVRGRGWDYTATIHTSAVDKRR